MLLFDKRILSSADNTMKYSFTDQSFWKSNLDHEYRTSLNIGNITAESLLIYIPQSGHDQRASVTPSQRICLYCMHVYLVVV